MSLCIHDLDEGSCSTCTGLDKKVGPKPRKVTVLPPQTRIPPRGTQERRDWYRNEYLRSDHWAKVKKDAHKNKPKWCYGCGAKDRPLQLHHLGYRLYNERGRDLVLVCAPCHKGIHGLREQERVTIRVATKMWKKMQKWPDYDPRIVRAEKEKRGKHYKKYAKHREYRRSLQAPKARPASGRGRGYKSAGDELSRKRDT